MPESLPKNRRRIERRVRAKHALKPSVLFGVAMGLAYLPSSPFSLSGHSTSPLTPIVMGFLNGLLFFVVQLAPRPRWMRIHNEEQIQEEIATLEAFDVAESSQKPSNQPR